MPANKEHRIAMLNKGMVREIKVKGKKVAEEMEGVFGKEFANLIKSGKTREASEFVDEMRQKVEAKKAKIRADVLKANWQQLCNCLEEEPRKELTPLEKALIIVSESELYDKETVEEALKCIDAKDPSLVDKLDERAKTNLLRMWILEERGAPQVAEPAPSSEYEHPRTTERAIGPAGEEETRVSTLEEENDKKRAMIEKLDEFLKKNKGRENGDIVRKALLLAKAGGIGDSTALANLFNRLYYLAKDDHNEILREVFPKKKDYSVKGWVAENFSTLEQMRDALEKQGVRTRREFFFLMPNSGRIYLTDGFDRNVLAKAIKLIEEKPAPAVEEAPVPEQKPAVPAPNPLEIVKSSVEALGGVLTEWEPERLLATIKERFGITPVETDAAWVPQLREGVLKIMIEDETRKSEEAQAARIREIEAENARVLAEHAQAGAAQGQGRRQQLPPFECQGIKETEKGDLARLAKKLAKEENLTHQEIHDHMTAIIKGFNFVSKKTFFRNEDKQTGGIDGTHIVDNVGRALECNADRAREILGLLISRNVVSGKIKKKLGINQDTDSIGGTWKPLMAELQRQRNEIVFATNGKGKKKEE